MVDVEDGCSVMDAAVDSRVLGIDGRCGGRCACASCHVYIDAPWAERCGRPDQLETAILEFAAEVRPASRLACQIPVTERLDGLVVRISPRQT